MIDPHAPSLRSFGALYYSANLLFEVGICPTRGCRPQQHDHRHRLQVPFSVDLEFTPVYLDGPGTCLGCKPLALRIVAEAPYRDFFREYGCAINHYFSANTDN